MTRQINAAGLDLIKSFETLKLSAYMPTQNDVPTIGWGHTSGVKMGDTCTEDKAEAFLRADLAWAEAAVEDNVTVPLTDDEFAGLVSLCFNIGAANFDHSTLLRDLDSGDYDAAAAQFAVWNKQHGITLGGLVRRRAAEEALFETPNPVAVES